MDEIRTEQDLIDLIDEKQREAELENPKDYFQERLRELIKRPTDVNIVHAYMSAVMKAVSEDELPIPKESDTAAKYWVSDVTSVIGSKAFQCMSGTTNERKKIMALSGGMPPELKTVYAKEYIEWRKLREKGE